MKMKKIENRLLQKKLILLIILIMGLILRKHDEIEIE